MDLTRFNQAVDSGLPAPDFAPQEVMPMCREDDLIRKIDALNIVQDELHGMPPDQAKGLIEILRVHRRIREMPVTARLEIPAVQPLNFDTGLPEKDARSLSEMLTGNINRMMVTHDLKELRTMYEFAERRLQAIHRLRIHDLEIAEATHAASVDPGSPAGDMAVTGSYINPVLRGGMET